MADRAGPSYQPIPTLAQGTAGPEDGGRYTGRLRPNVLKAPTATIKLCSCFESKTGRNLIVCIDGTSNQFGINNTNVVELYSLIKSQDDEGREQLTFYNSGIGTYAEPSWKSLSYIMQVICHKIDMAIAWNFERIIIAAYLWLSEQYQPGDRIYLFGFSRGAYQVRALAAMMDKVGLIKKGNQEQIPFAYQLYAACGEKKKKQTWSIWGKLAKLVPSVFKSSKPTPSAEQMAKHFREAFSRLVNIHFIGAWDTVSSVGTVRDKSLPGTTDGMHQACYFRHAMALDERRVKFLPEYAYGGTSLSAAHLNERLAADVAQQHADGSNVMNEATEAAGGGMACEMMPIVQMPRKTTDETESATNRYIHTKEVWFAGTHSDIGGGNVENPDMDRARPPLRWMCFEAAAAGLRLHPIQRELKPGEKTEVRESLTWVWWFLELLPLKRLSYERTGTDSTRRPHCGAGRIIQKGQKIHCSLLPDKNVPQGDNVNTTYVPKACPPGEDHKKFWESLRNPTPNTAPDQGMVEYDWYDSVHGIIEDYKNPNGDADAKRKHLREIYDMAQSGEGQLALREAKVADVIQLPKAEGAQWFVDLDLVMNVMERIAEGESLKTFGFRARQRRNMPKVEGKRNRQIADRFLRDFTNEYLVLPGHDWAVSSVAFSPDGQHIVSGSWDKTIRIWDAHTGMMVGEPVRGHTDWVWSVAFSPDGTRIVSGSDDRTIRLWDAQTGKKVGKPLQGHTASVRSVAFSPDGTRIVSGSCDSTIRISDARTGEPVGELLRGHTYWVPSVAFSRDGTRIVSGSTDKTIRISDARTGEPVGELLRGHTTSVYSVAFSPDGTRIVSGSTDETIRIWDAMTGEPVGEPLRGHEWPVYSVAFSPDGKVIASGSRDRTVRLWDVDSYVNAIETS